MAMLHRTLKLGTVFGFSEAGVVSMLLVNVHPSGHRWVRLDLAGQAEMN